MTAEKLQLGEAIRSARMRKGLTQEALAELLDITPIHLKNMESSRRKPSVPLLFEMMELLEFSVDALVFPDRETGGSARLWNGWWTSCGNEKIRAYPQI